MRRHLLFLIVDFFTFASLFSGIQKEIFFRSGKDKDKGLQATQAEHKKGFGVSEAFLFFLSFFYLFLSTLYTSRIRQRSIALAWMVEQAQTKIQNTKK
jgi:hypothetical protein